MSSNKQINALTFATATALLAAFENGAKFAVVSTDPRRDAPLGSGPVTKIELRSSGTRFNCLDVSVDGGAAYSNFNVRGEHGSWSWVRLVLVEEVQRTTGFSLEALLKGERFVCPKTGEVVAAVHVFRPEVPAVSPALEVEFVGGRTSDNYRLDGTHRHDAARDLAPQPKTKTMRVEVAREDRAPHRIQSLTFAVTPQAVKRNAGEPLNRGLGGMWTVVAAHEFEVPA